MTYGDVNRPIFKAVICIFIFLELVYILWLDYTGAPRDYANGIFALFTIFTILFIIAGSLIIGSYNEERALRDDPCHQRQKAINRRWKKLNRNH